jgi:acetyltransferase-like isoleucine patch superfamily enzyme
LGAHIFTHEFTQNKIRKGKVNIKKRALIGGFSVISSWVTIGKHAVVSLNSFVKKDVDEYETVGGNPAKRIKLSN